MINNKLNASLSWKAVDSALELTTQWWSIYLCDVGQSNDVRNKADNCNEDFSAFSEEMREFINQSSDEAFHSAELRRLQSHVRTVT